MKEKYTKPAFTLELFTLSSNVAENCGWRADGIDIGKPAIRSSSDCGWEYAGTVVWVDDDHGCAMQVEEDFDIEGYCYNYPVAGNSVFGSN
mgnify:CR=1 FL=1